MAYKSKILERYQKTMEENPQKSFNERLCVVMQEKFVKLEIHIQQIKDELNLKSSFIDRTNKFEQMFVTVKTGIHFDGRSRESDKNKRMCNK